ncbi:MAG: hypothetical protein ACJA1A_001705 [Saprospiraceae bacterium]|jgi:hypothetical protein
MRYQFFFLFSIVLFLFSCSEQSAQEEKAIILTEPSNDSEVSHCCLVFAWEPIASELEYRFQLSTDLTFNTILIDTLINADSLFVDYLSPTNIYYWKVTSSFNNFTSAVSSFNVINYGEYFSGQYIGTETVYSYYLAEEWVTHIDSTYNTTINIQSTLDGKFIINDDTLNYYPTFDEKTIKLGLPNNWEGYSKTATINLDSDSLVYIFGIYGGGGRYTSTTTALLR